MAWGRSGSDAGVDVGLGTEDEEVTTAGESEGSDDVVTRTAVDVVAGTAGGVVVIGIVGIAEMVVVTKTVDCAAGDEEVVSGAGKR